MAYLIRRCLLRGKTRFSISNRFASGKFLSQNLKKNIISALLNMLQFDIHQWTYVSAAAPERDDRRDLATNNLKEHQRNNQSKLFFTSLQ